ncbi:phosphatase PAP2 family protein [Streptomyces palmae]|uniref:Phosphatase PAP2 family protein n=1 Tax=Streptomyces palmae TaxID=1701085 RepID=A0A4Z0H7B8_9ACTN|nr:phosphatase PAP2 family protein [Streptomyces palmae]TGB09648.1 phosphatase PAP2 family protein [Streptomyces palmae]
MSPLAPVGPAPTPLALDGASVDGSLYTEVTDLARHAPGLLSDPLAAWSTAGLVLLAVLMAAGWWRARSDDAARMAAALSAPLAAAAAFGLNDVIKALVREQRPCQTLHTVTLEACPAPGDWSFPSNHTAIAAAAAVALLLADRRLGAVAVLTALLMGVSRVWVGAHYPHDVAVGLLVGAVTGWAVGRAARRAAPAVRRLRASRLGPWFST